MKSTYTIAVNEVIGLSAAETILMQFEYDQQKINDPETTLRAAIKDYLKTDEGKRQVNMNCGCFNWAMHTTSRISSLKSTVLQR